MFERLIPKYFRDKAKELDIKQVRELPEDIRYKIIHGNEAEAREAINNIKSRERMQKVHVLDDAAYELLSDMRAMVEHYEENN